MQDLVGQLSTLFTAQYGLEVTYDLETSRLTLPFRFDADITEIICQTGLPEPDFDLGELSLDTDATADFECFRCRGA